MNLVGAFGIFNNTKGRILFGMGKRVSYFVIGNRLQLCCFGGEEWKWGILDCIIKVDAINA